MLTAALTDENLAAMKAALMVQRRVGRSDATKAVWKDEMTAALLVGNLVGWRASQRAVRWVDELVGTKAVPWVEKTVVWMAGTKDVEWAEYSAELRAAHSGCRSAGATGCLWVVKMVAVKADSRAVWMDVRTAVSKVDKKDEKTVDLWVG